ncbi:MAG TPA: PQQ-binding-like beta-propeller repeat protein, partial [Sphingomicrobium sp.]|nr:PQQ-binding-like beta-propeller repeat protein [Sphingomicrobium sp.]
MINKATLSRAGAAAFLMAAGLTGPLHAQRAVSTTVESPRSLTGIRFRFQADGPVRGGFGLVSGRLLFGTETGTIYALDAR